MDHRGMKVTMLQSQRARKPKWRESFRLVECVCKFGTEQERLQSLFANKIRSKPLPFFWSCKDVVIMRIYSCCIISLDHRVLWSGSLCLIPVCMLGSFLSVVCLQELYRTKRVSFDQEHFFIFFHQVMFHLELFERGCNTQWFHAQTFQYQMSLTSRNLEPGAVTFQTFAKD